MFLYGYPQYSFLFWDIFIFLLKKKKNTRMSWFWKGTFSQIRCQEYKQGCLNISCVNSQCSQYEQKSLRTRKEGKGSALAPWVFKHLLVPSFDLSMIFTTAALKGENSGWEEDGIRCADYGMRQFRMCLWRTWNEWGVESLSVRAAPASLVTGACMHPFMAPNSSQNCVGTISQETF